MLGRLQRPLALAFAAVERLADRAFPPAVNPLRNLGALGFFYYWVAAASGVYVYIFFDTGVTEAYASIESLTRDQWYVGGVMRSLHRYASDGMVLMLAVHMTREFAHDRYRGRRWFTWVTGLPVAGLVIAAGITGYWLVWDGQAQYIALMTAEWLDWLPIFGEPLARNFLVAELFDDRLFTLLTFMHVALPLILLGVLWIHLQRVSRPRVNPPRALALGTFGMLLVLALLYPAVSGPPADLAVLPDPPRIDWYFLGLYPLIEATSRGAAWGLIAGPSVILAALPFLPPLRTAKAAAVDLDNCNGCKRCAQDCPYGAVTMRPRSDGKAFDLEAAVDPALCVACGLCMGACPTATPFRRGGALVPGIDLPERSAARLREELLDAMGKLEGPQRLLVIGCEHGTPVEALESQSVATLVLPCIGALPPSFIDFALARGAADGVLLAGCPEGGCFNRFGVAWTKARVARSRDPMLRARVPRDRLRCFWGGILDGPMLRGEAEDFARALASLRAEAPLPGAVITKAPVDA